MFGFLVSGPRVIPGPTDIPIAVYSVMNPFSFALLFLLILRVVVAFKFRRSLGMKWQKIKFNTSRLKAIVLSELGFWISLCIGTIAFSWSTFIAFSWYPPPDQLISFMRRELNRVMDWHVASIIAVGSIVIAIALPYVVGQYLKHKQLEKLKE